MKDIENIIWIRNKMNCSILDAKKAYYFCDEDKFLACAYLKEIYYSLGHNPPWTNEQYKERAKEKLNYDKNNNLHQ